MTSLSLLLYGQLACSVVMLIGWLFAIRIRNASYVDVLWSYGVGIVGLFYLVLLSDGCDPARLALLQGLLGVWSVRLGTHLLRRCWGKPEDARYTYLREYLGENASWGLLGFFQVQAFWTVLFASPFLILVRNPEPLGLWDHIGVMIWIIGFVGVTISDKQLRQFKSQPKRTRKEVCDSGLWKYSRHPNYFFEWILWLGYIPMGVGADGWAWLFSIPPILYLFLTKITGIPFVEARKLEASGEEYQKYLDRTPAFFPGHPKPTVT